MSNKALSDNYSEKKETESPNIQTDLVRGLFRPVEPRHHRPGINWRLVLWIIFGLAIILFVVVSGFVIFYDPTQFQQKPVQVEASLITPTRPTPSATPEATPSATLQPVSGAEDFTFIGPTAIWTPVSGGQGLVLKPQAQDAGWVVSDDESILTIYDPQNHFGDSYLYVGVLDRKVYHAAFQFDLSRIPRGTKVYGASLRLTGLRSDLLGQEGEGQWQLQFLASEMDIYWRSVNYQQIHHANLWSTFEPPLTQEQLGVGQVNLFEFTSAQLALLERRILEGSEQFGAKVSFRLDGPMTGGDNLFAWDSGSGPASQNSGPELFLNLGPPPRETPPPSYLIITSTPTPENVATAVANSLRLTAEATRLGTATPLPPGWVTPLVVTATPTPENEATAQVMGLRTTATALAGGPPPNVVTATPTPTYMIITSTPTPENVLTAATISVQMTAGAAQVGTATPLPLNWVTPLVVTSTPTPENTATIDYWQAVALTTGTPTPLPNNAQTATPTPIFIPIEPIISPTPMATPSATPQPIPVTLLGKIVFLSDREGPIEKEPPTAAQLVTTPQAKPHTYVFDPETGQLGRLTDRWPYEVAAARDAWSADLTYEAYTQQLLWTNVEDDLGNRRPTEVLAIHYYDYLYKVERLVTRMGAGIAYDPAWSPVSNEIAFVATESSNDEIWVINHDGSNARQLTRNQWEWDKHPSWSPDGQQIVFYSNRTGNNQLWIMNKDGNEQRLLMAWTSYNDSEPVWIKYLDPAPPLTRKPDWRFLKSSGEN